MDNTSTGTTDRNITDTVIAAVARMLSREPAAISSRTRLVEDLAFDSTMVLELLITLESDLDTEVDPETLEPDDFDTIGALSDYLARHLEA